MKYSPSATVKAKPCVVWAELLDIRAWWAQVTLTPDETRIIVLRRGTPNGLKGITPMGGQILPSSTLGVRLAWK